MTREREKRGLISAMNYFEIGEGIIITSDILDEEIFQDRKITYFPLWFWLLTEESESYI
jgi:predicted AAA+ superfamily ATPase